MDVCRSRVSMSSQPTLHLLFHQIKILSIDKPLLPTITHTLLGITLKLLDRDPLYRRYAWIDNYNGYYYFVYSF